MAGGCARKAQDLFIKPEKFCWGQLNLDSLLAEVRLLQLSVPSATSSKTDHVFPVGTGTWIEVCNTYVHTHRSTQADTQSTHMNTNSSKGLILYSSLVVQDEGLLVGKHTHSRSLSLPSSSPWILVFPVAGTWIFKLLGLQPHSSCWLLISLTLVSPVAGTTDTWVV